MHHMTRNVPYICVLTTRTNICQWECAALRTLTHPYLQGYDRAHEQAGRVEFFLDLKPELPLSHEIV